MSVDVVSNISKYWGLNNIEVKKRTQELVFPEVLSLDIKNRRYLTKNVNLFLISSALSRDTMGINDKKQPISRLLFSLPYGFVDYLSELSNKNKFKEDIFRLNILADYLTLNLIDF